MRVIVSRQMDNWKLPLVNSSLNVWGLTLWQHTIFIEVTDRTLRSIKCSRSAVFLKIHRCENKWKLLLVGNPSIFCNVFGWETRRRAMERSWHHTASTRYWLRYVTYHNLDTYQNWQCLIENRISGHAWLKTFLSSSHNLRNRKLIFKNCWIKAYFDATVSASRLFSPFLNVCTDWLYTLSQCIGEQNQRGLHIRIHWRSFTLGFCRKLIFISN